MADRPPPGAPRDRLALLTPLNAQTHRPPAIRPSHQLNGLPRVVRHDLIPLIARSRQALANALLEGHR